MNNRNTDFLLILMIAVSVIAGAIIYPRLPDLIASHWGLAGEVNGYMGKLWGVFMLPLIMFMIFILYYIIPRIDPLRNNIRSFRQYYNGFWVLISGFLLYIYILMLAWNLGYRFDFSVAMITALAVLFYFIGSFLGKLKRNWFMGIRTPWTMSSDTVWDKTHKLGGRLFKVTAVIMLAGVFFPRLFGWFLFVPILATTLITLIYSYFEYKKSGKNKNTR